MSFVDRLREEGERRYHSRHPFHVRMHAGELSREELQRWVVNRWYYQTRIPIKDAIILSKSEDPAFRRSWIRRIHDHDGVRESEGGLANWLRLAEAVGLEPQELRSERRVIPAVRFACDAYVTLVRERSLVEAVASSLTEVFSPDLMQSRIAAFREHYPWVDVQKLAYFQERVSRARADGQEALAFVVEHVKTREQEERCLDAFRTKCDILWSLLDAVAAG